MHKDQGNVGEAAAILYFTKIGAKVSKPLFENTPYDLIVDDGISLYRVQIKSTSYLSKYDIYQVELRTKGGNTSWNGVIKLADSSGCDKLFVYCSNGDAYLIPVMEFDGQGRISLGVKYESFRVM